jgi:P27 family predicted phage terminase small subunit
MGKRGPKARTTAEKVKAGEYRNERLNHDEPTPDKISSDTPAPERFQKFPRKVELWGIYIGFLEHMHLLSKVDVHALEELVHHKYLGELAEDELDKNGAVIWTTNSAGAEVMIENPWNNVKIKSSDRVLKLLTQFGVTPTARTSLKVEKPKENKSGLKLLMGKTA